MKPKHYFTLGAILIILFSLSSVVASENITYDAYSGDALGIGNNQASVDDKLSDGLSDEPEEIDLSVRLDVANVYGSDNEFNRAGYEVPWNITVKLNGGTARNVKVKEILSDNMEYVSHNASVGKFDSVSGIWDIGDFIGPNSTVLTIVTKLKSDGKFINTVNATTDSADIDSSNNFCTLYIKSGTSKSTSNTTETTSDKNKPQHNLHYASGAGNSGLGVTRETPKTDSNSGSKNGNSKSRPNKNSKSDSVSKSLTKNSLETSLGAVKSFADTMLTDDQSLDEAEDSQNSTTLNGENSNLKSTSSSSHVDAVFVYDYTTIPILIFALFLVALVAIVGYDKIKS